METLTNKTAILKSAFPYIIIAIMAIVIFMQRSCYSPTPPAPPKTSVVNINGQKFDVQKQTTDTQWMSTPPQIVIRPGKVIHKDSIVYVEIPPCDDTLAILEDYFAKKIYSDTLRLKDSLGYIAVQDTLNRNEILTRIWDAHINTMKITDTFYLSTRPRTQWYFGGLIGATRPNTTMAGASLLVKNKRDCIYSLNAGYTSNLNLFVQGTVFWKIKFKK